MLAPDFTKTVSKSKLTVQITLALLGDAAATLLLVVLEDTDLLEGLEDLAVNGARGVNVVGGTAATVLGSAVDAAETANTNGLAEVDVAGNGGGADVEPVDVLGGHLLGGAGLDGINPTCCRELADCLIHRFWGSSKPTGNGQLALALQESSIGVDELVGLHITQKYHQQ